MQYSTHFPLLAVIPVTCSCKPPGCLLFRLAALVGWPSETQKLMISGPTGQKGAICAAKMRKKAGPKPTRWPLWMD